METREAYQQYLVTAQQNADYMNTLLWILFVIFIMAPVIYFIMFCIYYFFFARKN